MSYAGRPMVLVHGWGCPITYWDRLVGALGPAGGQVTRFVAPGYEGIDVVDWTFSLAAERLIGSIEDRGEVPASVVAHSMGMFIVGEVVRKRPDLLQDVTIIGGVPTPPATTGVNPAVDELLAHGALAPHTIEACMRSWYLGENRPEDRLDTALRNVSPRVLLSSAQACADAPPLSSWDIAEMPIHVITGDMDQTRTPKQVADFVKRASCRTWTVVPGAGHMAHWTHPEHVARAMRSFHQQTATV